MKISSLHIFHMKNEALLTYHWSYIHISFSMATWFHCVSMIHVNAEVCRCHSSIPLQNILGWNCQNMIFLTSILVCSRIGPPYIVFNLICRTSLNCYNRNTILLFEYDIQVRKYSGCKHRYKPSSSGMLSMFVSSKNLLCQCANGSAINLQLQ